MPHGPACLLEMMHHPRRRQHASQPLFASDFLGRKLVRMLRAVPVPLLQASWFQQAFATCWERRCCRCGA